MATVASSFPVVNDLTHYVSEINKLKDIRQVPPELIAVLKKLFLLIVNNLQDLSDASNQTVMGGPTANRPDATKAGRTFFDTTTTTLYVADDAGVWHSVVLT